MPLSTQSVELQRLIRAFEAESLKFHDLRLSTFFITLDESSPDRKFINPNHTIMLWQYCGRIGPEQREAFFANMQASDFQWGLRGADFSSFAVIEGAECELFVKMAKRAGSLFSEEEALAIKTRMLDDFLATKGSGAKNGKPVMAANRDPLAIWINFLLYHLSMTNPGREHGVRIEPDPFTLSLLALERLSEDQKIGKIDRSKNSLESIKFQVAMSFPGVHRKYVAKVVNNLRSLLGPDSVFYDYDYQSQLARPNLDTLLQEIYRNRSELVVVCLCAEYGEREWCGLEWRAIRDIIKSKKDRQIMFIRFDDSPLDGVFSIDGYIDARMHSAEQVANFIAERVSLNLNIEINPYTSSFPCSNNLKLPEPITDKDHDVFLSQGFIYISKFFSNSLKEFEKSNSGISFKFDIIDSTRFTAVIYKLGNKISACTIWSGGEKTISYSNKLTNLSETFNEQLSVASDNALFFKPLGMVCFRSDQTSSKLSKHEAAEFYWEIFLEPLHR